MCDNVVGWSHGQSFWPALVGHWMLGTNRSYLLIGGSAK